MALGTGGKKTPQHQATWVFNLGNVDEVDTKNEHDSSIFCDEWNEDMRMLGEVNDQAPFGLIPAAASGAIRKNGAPPFFFDAENNSLTSGNRITSVISTAASTGVDALAIQQTPGNFSWKKELPSLIKTTNKAAYAVLIALAATILIAGKRPLPTSPAPRLTSALAALSTPVAQSFLLFKMRKQQKQYATEIEAYNQHLKDNPDEAKQWNKYKRGLYTSLAARTLINSKSAIFNKRVIDEDETAPLTKDEMFAYLGGTVLEPLLNTAEIIGRWIFYKKYIAAARQWYAEQYVE
jgi:hypothetical protein